MLRDIERCWETLRDIESGWETLRDVERRWETYLLTYQTIHRPGSWDAIASKNPTYVDISWMAI